MEKVAITHSETTLLIKKIYCIEGSADVLKRFEDFLAFVQHCTETGNFITVGFGVDGDGTDCFRVQTVLPPVEEDNVRRYRHGFDIHVS